MTSRAKRRMAARILDGMCSRCGKLPPADNRELCTACLAWFRARYARVRSPTDIVRTCTICKQRGHNRLSCQRRDAA